MVLGKSTIFRMILNLIEPTEGEIKFNNEKIDQKVLDKFGYLPEEGSLLPHFSVIDICEYYGSLKLMNKDEIINSLTTWLKEFNLRDKSQALAHHLCLCWIRCPSRCYRSEFLLIFFF